METPQLPSISPQQALPAPGTTDSEKSDIEQNKDIAAFSYLWVMSVVVYFLKRKSPFVRFHAKQAMVLFALSIIVLFVPYVNRLLELMLMGLMAYGFVSAAQGLKRDVPIVGQLSRGEISPRQAWKQLVDMIVSAVNAIKSSMPKKDASPPPPSTPPSNSSSQATNS